MPTVSEFQKELNELSQRVASLEQSLKGLSSQMASFTSSLKELQTFMKTNPTSHSHRELEMLMVELNSDTRLLVKVCNENIQTLANTGIKGLRKVGK